MRGTKKLQQESGERVTGRIPGGKIWKRSTEGWRTWTGRLQVAVRGYDWSPGFLERRPGTKTSIEVSVSSMCFRKTA